MVSEFFFLKLSSIVNLIGASTKHHMRLKYVWEVEITYMLASGKLETSIGVNQIRTLQRATTTR